MMRKTFFLFLILGFNSLLAQVPNNETDSVKVDTTIVSTVVIRSQQDKIKYIPRGVNLTNPHVSFNRTKARTKPFNRFTIPSFWDKTNSFGLSINEVAFINWNAGGNNSISALGNVKFVRNYKFRYVQWQNSMDLRYGLSSIEGEKLRKADDAIRFSSSFAYRRDTISNWYYSANITFNTQFANGYKYPNRDNKVSKFMAPGYLLVGAGASYIPEGKKFNLFISPLTQKATFVLDEELANAGAFGVKKAVRDTDGNIIKKGERTNMELGFLVTNKWKTTVYDNMNLEHEISLYSDYINSFGNVDIDWELRLAMKVNQYVKATLGTNLLYDDDIRFDVVKAADGTITDPGKVKTQFKQLLGVGLSYDF